MKVPTAIFVPDASVILKWVLDAEDEPGHAAANHLLERWQMPPRFSSPYAISV